jgi:hypothetical protein
MTSQETFAEFFLQDDFLQAFLDADFSSKDFIHGKLKTSGKKADNLYDEDINKLNTGIDRIQLDVEKNVRSFLEEFF